MILRGKGQNTEKNGLTDITALDLSGFRKKRDNGYNGLLFTHYDALFYYCTNNKIKFFTMALLIITIIFLVLLYKYGDKLPVKYDDEDRFPKKKKKRMSDREWCKNYEGPRPFWMPKKEDYD